MRRKLGPLAVHLVLGAYTMLAIFPILLVLYNSFKSRKAIFGAPLALPGPESFSLIGYEKVFADSAVPLYYFNSISITVTTIFITLLIGAMAAWALTEYRFRWNTLLGIYLAIGIMVPIRLGSV
jgi:raffinose/stachyose/melibiose transport system permease protein